jgi:hypothetical protein
MRYALVLLLAALAGCAGPWVKPNMTAEEKRRDFYECKMLSRIIPGGAIWNNTFRDCMHARGYEQED